MFFSRGTPLRAAHAPVDVMHENPSSQSTLNLSQGLIEMLSGTYGQLKVTLLLASAG